MEHSVPMPAGRRDTDSPSLFLRLPAVMKMTGLGRSTIYRMVAAKTFPSPVKIANRAIAWRRADLDLWSDSRPAVAH